MLYAQRLRELREAHGLSQTDIARVLHTTQSQISKWENGVSTMRTRYYVALAKYYNVSLDYIAGLTDTPWKLR